MTTQETKGYKFEKVSTLSLREGDVIKFATSDSGTTIARVKGMRRCFSSPNEMTIEIDALWSTQGENWFIKQTKEGYCAIYKRKYSSFGPFGYVLKGTAK